MRPLKGVTLVLPPPSPRTSGPSSYVTVGTVRYGVRFGGNQQGGTQSKRELLPSGDAPNHSNSNGGDDCCCGTVQLQWPRAPAGPPSSSSRIPLPSTTVPESKQQLSNNRRGIFSRINSAELSRGISVVAPTQQHCQLTSDPQHLVYRSTLEWSLKQASPPTQQATTPKPTLRGVKHCFKGNEEEDEGRYGVGRMKEDREDLPLQLPPPVPPPSSQSRRRILVRTKPDIPAYLKLCSSVSTDGDTSYLLTHGSKENLPEEPDNNNDTVGSFRRNTLERLHRFRFGGGGGATGNKEKGERKKETASGRSGRAKKKERSSDQSERLRELTEKLKGNASPSSDSRRKTPSSADGASAVVNQIIPSLASSTSGVTRETTLKKDSAKKEPDNGVIKTTEVTGVKDALVKKMNSGDGVILSSSGASAETSISKEDDIFECVNLRLPKPESRTIVGSYIQRTIPFRSASFSQVDFCSADGKYIRSNPRCSPYSTYSTPASGSVTLPLSPASSIAGGSLTLPRKKLTEISPTASVSITPSSSTTIPIDETIGSNPSVDSAVGSEESFSTSTIKSHIPILGGDASTSDIPYKASGIRSLTYPLPRRGCRPDDEIPFSSIDGNGLKSLSHAPCVIGAGRELKGVEEEGENWQSETCQGDFIVCALGEKNVGVLSFSDTSNKSESVKCDFERTSPTLESECNLSPESVVSDQFLQTDGATVDISKCLESPKSKIVRQWSKHESQSSSDSDDIIASKVVDVFDTAQSLLTKDDLHYCEVNNEDSTNIQRNTLNTSATSQLNESSPSDQNCAKTEESVSQKIIHLTPSEIPFEESEPIQYSKDVKILVREESSDSNETNDRESQKPVFVTQWPKVEERETDIDGDDSEKSRVDTDESDEVTASFQQEDRALPQSGTVSKQSSEESPDDQNELKLCSDNSQESSPDESIPHCELSLPIEDSETVNSSSTTNFLPTNNTSDPGETKPTPWHRQESSQESDSSKRWSGEVCDRSSWGVHRDETQSPDDNCIPKTQWSRSLDTEKKRLNRPKLICQSSEEREDDSNRPSPRRYPILIRTDSLSEGESDQGDRRPTTPTIRDRERDRTASPSLFSPSDLSDSEGRGGGSSAGLGSESRNQHTPRRYYKRPLRGPYGQMLEAEMKKPDTGRTFSKRQYNEDLKFLEEYASPPPQRPPSPTESTMKSSPVTGPPFDSLRPSNTDDNRACSLRHRSLTTHSFDDSQLKDGYGRSPPSASNPPTPMPRSIPKRKVSAPYSAPSPTALIRESSGPGTFVCHQRTTSSPSQLEGYTRGSGTSTRPEPTPELLAELLRGSSERISFSPNNSVLSNIEATVRDWKLVGFQAGVWPSFDSLDADASLTKPSHQEERLVLLDQEVGNIYFNVATGSVPAFSQSEGESGKPFRKNYSQYTRPRSNHDLPVIGSLVFCESSTLDHVATESGFPVMGRSGFESRLDMKRVVLPGFILSLNAHTDKQTTTYVVVLFPTKRGLQDLQQQQQLTSSPEDMLPTAI
uniref:Uncharacterized protein n=1 Tax=Timema tahoe TaxID=61484 RepID=A0A7R9FEQ6_9NEOP|nr:unnamed protein product [Timema tahoe]